MIAPINTGKIEFDISTYRNHQKQKNDSHLKYKVALGSMVGTAVPLVALAKKQKTNIFNIKYNTMSMVLLSAGAILGGLATGVLAGKKEHRKQKINEGVFQFFNATIPTMMVAGIYSMIKKCEKLNNVPVKIIGAFAGLVGGMFLASELANRVNDPYDKVPDRKLTIKDAVANIDDAVGVLVVSKVPLTDKLPIEKVLPAVYGWCGYRAGMSN